jgi:hypothetical protein
VPLRYLDREPRVLSLMVELRRDLYMDETSGAQLAGFDDCARLVRSTLRRIARTVGGDAQV